MNKYLVKIAKEQELENPSYTRMAGKGLLYGAGMSVPVLGGVLGIAHGARSSYANQVEENGGEAPKDPSFGRMAGKGLLYGILGGMPVVGTGMGIYHGVQSSKANQLAEQEALNEALQKHAQLVSDQTKKDLIKLSSLAHPDLRDPDYGRGVGRAMAYAVPTNLLTSRAVSRTIGSLLPEVSSKVSGNIGRVAGIAAGLGMGIQGEKASYKNQLREQQLHDIKLQGAAQRQESHQARMAKHAQLMSDQTKKDVVGTGTIAALGGVGNVASGAILHRMEHGASTAAKTPFSLKGALASIKGANYGKLGKTFAVGTGVGLAADYAGLKISHAFNKHVDAQSNPDQNLHL